MGPGRAGTVPTVGDAEARLAHLREHGPGAYAVTMREPRPPAGTGPGARPSSEPGRRRRALLAILVTMPALPAVHPMQPRFAQAITGTLCLEAIVFDTPAAVAVALGLVLLGLAGPRWSPVTWVFRHIAPPPRELEPAAPARFSQALAAVFLSASVALLFAGAEPAGWILAGLVAALALVSAISGLCVGCEAYRLLLARRGRAEGDLRADLGLTGSGPWLVVLTAPGCARCEPVAREMERVAGDREVVRVSLAEHPRAAALPVRSVPAAIVVGADGRLRAARAGRLEAPELSRVVAAL